MMSLFWWSVVVTGFSLCTAWLVGNRHRWCWHFGLVTQFVYAVYSIDTGQLPGLVTVALFTTMYVRNIFKWRADGVVASTPSPVAAACGCHS